VFVAFVSFVAFAIRYSTGIIIEVIPGLGVNSMAVLIFSDTK
jgi:hypothetical protein